MLDNLCYITTKSISHAKENTETDAVFADEGGEENENDNKESWVCEITPRLKVLLHKYIDNTL